MLKLIRTGLAKLAVLLAVLVANANLDAASIFIIYEPEPPQ